jgi:hypothetical protein
MAKPAPKAPVDTPTARPRRKPKPQGRKVLAPVIFITSMVVLAVVALPIFILLIVGMIPSGVAYVVDRTPRRMLTLTVGPCNFAATVPFCMQLWFGSDTIQSLGHLMASPWIWLVMYLGAGVGWLFHFGMPVIVTSVLERSLDHRKTKYVSIQKSLRKEWGDEVDPTIKDP